MPTAQVVKLRPRSNHNLAHLTQRFHSALAKSVEGIIEAGRVLLEGKAELEHGQFLKWVEDDLGISARTSQYLMLIARNPVISNTKNFSHLPPCSKSLYELCQIPKQRLTDLLADGKINPGQTIEEIVSIRKGGTRSGVLSKSSTSKLRKELATLVNLTILLGGGDVVLNHIRNITDVRDIRPSRQELAKVIRWLQHQKL
jgi:hypothetical protein